MPGAGMSGFEPGAGIEGTPGIAGTEGPIALTWGAAAGAAGISAAGRIWVWATGAATAGAAVAGAATAGIAGESGAEVPTAGES